MKRKQFLYTISLLALIPILEFEWKSYHHDPLTEAKELWKFCSFIELKIMGEKYRQLKPEENSKDQLSRLLRYKESTNNYVENNNSLRKLIHNKVKRDYQNANTLLLNGWVISQTEARQCGLISLQQ